MAILAAGPALEAAAQLPQPPLQPIEPSVADVNPLSTSLRDMQVDLRQPTGFQNVYRVPGQEDKLMRISGGLVAVFPQSAYVNTAQGNVPIIPAGTYFYIGSPWSLPGSLGSELPPGIDPSDKRLDMRRETFVASAEPHQLNGRVNTFTEPTADQVAALPQAPRAADAISAAAPSTTSSAPLGTSIVTDAGYRAQRLQQLMARAAEAQSQRPPRQAPQDHAARGLSPSSSK